MKSRKKLSIIILLIILTGITSAVIYLVAPYVRGINFIEELFKESYSYKIDCYVEGVTLDKGRYDKSNLYIEGEKYSNNIRCNLYVDNEQYLEVISDLDKNIIFNVKPMMNYVENKIEDALGITFGELSIDMADMYISLAQIEKVLGMDILDFNDFKAEDAALDTGGYSIKRIREPDNMNVDFNTENSYFFELTMKEQCTRVIVGFPQDRNCNYAYIDMEYEDIKLEMYMEYDMSKVWEISVPKVTFSDEDIDGFKEIYDKWMLIKKTYDNYIE